MLGNGCTNTMKVYAESFLYWNKSKLPNYTIVKNTEIRYLRILHLPEIQDINNKWEGFGKAINETAKKVIGKQERNELWDEEYRNIIKENNDIRMKAL